MNNSNIGITEEEKNLLDQLQLSFRTKKILLKVWAKENILSKNDLSAKRKINDPDLGVGISLAVIAISLALNLIAPYPIFLIINNIAEFLTWFAMAYSITFYLFKKMEMLEDGIESNPLSFRNIEIWHKSRKPANLSFNQYCRNIIIVLFALNGYFITALIFFIFCLIFHFVHQLISYQTEHQLAKIES